MCVLFLHPRPSFSSIFFLNSSIPYCLFICFLFLFSVIRLIDIALEEKKYIENYRVSEFCSSKLDVSPYFLLLLLKKKRKKTSTTNHFNHITYLSDDVSALLQLSSQNITFESSSACVCVCSICVYASCMQ